MVAIASSMPPYPASIAAVLFRSAPAIRVSSVEHMAVLAK
jgi:hypothetical protein